MFFYKGKQTNDLKSENSATIFFFFFFESLFFEIFAATDAYVNV